MMIFMMKKGFVVFAAMVMVFNFAGCSDDDSDSGNGGSGGGSSLIFSEYAEGSSNNKYLELYNPGSSAVDLAAYTLLYYANGATTVSESNTITNGTADSLVPGGVIVLANENATLFTGPIHRTYGYPSALAFNGDDAIALAKDGVVIDVLGTIGNAGDWGKDTTLVRKSTISSPSATFTASEWTVKGSNYTNTLGSWGDPPQAVAEGNYNAVDYTTTALTLDGGLSNLRAGGVQTGLTTTVTGIICAVEDNDEYWIQDKDTAIFCYSVGLQNPPVFGDQISFEVTEVGAYNGLLQITGITAISDSRQSSGNNAYVVDLTDMSPEMTTNDQGKLVRYTGSIASAGQFTGIGAFYNPNSTPGDFSTDRTGVWVGPVGEHRGTPQMYILSTNYYRMD